MQQGNCSINGSFFENSIAEADSPELSVQSKTHRALVHVQIHSQDTLFFKSLPVLAARRVAPASQLPQPIIAEPVLIVTEGRIVVKILLAGHPDFKLVFGTWIRMNLPVMAPRHERGVRDYRPEHILLFFQEDILPVGRQLNPLSHAEPIPFEACDPVVVAIV